jgi:hypothetical protein
MISAIRCWVLTGFLIVVIAAVATIIFPALCIVLLVGPKEC